MSKLEEDLALAHSLIEDKEKYVDYFWRFYRMWPFTTINMKEYLEPFNLENKKCVTIQGSSDHIFELFLKKPKKIIGVDTNPLTEYFCYLKMAAFKVLQYPEEFLKFFRWNDYPEFCDHNKEAFDKDIYKDIKKYLTGDKLAFWEDLFSSYDPIVIRTNMFNAVDETNNKALYQALNYLSKENYEYIRSNIDKIDFSFMNTDVRTLANELDENIDFITLSNLIIYANMMYPDNPNLGFKELTKDLSKKLNKDGNIVIGYLYDIENEEDHREVYIKKNRDKYFKGSKYSYNYIQKFHDLHTGRETKNHDAILIYTKK